MKLTKRAVDATHPGPGDKFLWDTELHGFGLKITPGGSKVYVLGYRLENGRRRRYTLPGFHGSPWTVETARTEAKRLLGRISQISREGEQQYDPLGERENIRQAETVEELVKTFLEYVLENRAPRTARDYRRILEQHVLPLLGKHKVTAVTEADVRLLHRSRKHAPRQADYMLAVLGSMFSYAEQEGLRQRGTNPCRNIKIIRHVQRRERFLSAQELGRLGEVLAQAEKDGNLTVPDQEGKPGRTVPVNLRALAAIRLIAFTGARLNEILTLRWENVNLERGVARLLEHKTRRKTGPKNLILPAPAVALLDGLGRIEGNPYVLPGHGAEGHLMNPYPTWYAVRELAGIPDVRIHDLRHSYASVAVSSGVSLYAVQKLLGHANAAMTERYAHLAPDPVQAAAELVGQRILEAMQPAVPRDNVHELPTGKTKRPRDS